MKRHTTPGNGAPTFSRLRIPRIHYGSVGFRNTLSRLKVGAPGAGLIAAIGLALVCIPVYAYERLQGPTEVLYWNKTNTYDGYTFFGVRSNTYLINMEGRVVHTWPVGINPHLLTNGNVLDAASGDLTRFIALKEVDWS